MLMIQYAKYGGCRSPGIAEIRSGAEKFVVVPIPVLREIGWCQGESGKMKSNPCATVFHIFFKSLSLQGIVRPGVQKNYNLVPGKKICIQIFPVICGIVRIMICRCH